MTLPNRLFAPAPDHNSWRLFFLAYIAQRNFHTAAETLKITEELVPGMRGKAMSLYIRAMTALHTDRIREINA
jgi:hypothetical protein